MKIKTIDIVAKEWFDRANGNSYFSGIVTVNYGMDTAENFRMPFQHGYGSYYEQEAERGLQNRYKQLRGMRLRDMRDKKGIIIRSRLQENCKKSEVVAFGQG